MEREKERERIEEDLVCCEWMEASYTLQSKFSSGNRGGEHNRRAPPLPDVPDRQAPLPGDERQRLGHQDQVSQTLII